MWTDETESWCLGNLAFQMQERLPRLNTEGAGVWSAKVLEQVELLDAGLRWRD